MNFLSSSLDFHPVTVDIGVVPIVFLINNNIKIIIN